MPPSDPDRWPNAIRARDPHAIEALHWLLLDLARAPSVDPTAREVDVIRLLADGKTAAAVGRELHIATETVKSHLKHIRVKLDAANTPHAVANALRKGWIE